MSDKDIWQQLHEGLTQELLDRIKNKTASAADLQVARQWLNDNRVAADPVRNSGLKQLGQAITDLPFDADGVPTKHKAH